MIPGHRLSHPLICFQHIAGHGKRVRQIGHEDIGPRGGDLAAQRRGLLAGLQCLLPPPEGAEAAGQLISPLARPGVKAS